MAEKQDYIAVFDSGVGGISVLSQLCKLMPNERFLYYGDNANAPYGTRPTQEVRRLTMEAVAALHKRNVKAFVIACNTATAAAINDLRKAYPDTIIIGIEPALKLAADHYPEARVGVLATPLTLKEEKFSNLAERFPQMQVHPIPLPGLVEKIEAGCDDRELVDFLRPTLAPYAGKLDAVVLGCTHYPFAAEAIRELLGKQVTILDGSLGTARETRRRLMKANLLFDGPGVLSLECSGKDSTFLHHCAALLQRSLG